MKIYSYEELKEWSELDLKRNCIALGADEEMVNDWDKDDCITYILDFFKGEEEYRISLLDLKI